MRALEDEADAAFGGDDALPLAPFGDDLPLAPFGDALPLAPFEGDDADTDFCFTPTLDLLLSDD